MKMVQLKHNPKTVEDFLQLHKGISEKLDMFKSNHTEFSYSINMYIGEDNHVIVINIGTDNAAGTGPNTEKTSGEI